jgi:hypothetical protein
MEKGIRTEWTRHRNVTAVREEGERRESYERGGQK